MDQQNANNSANKCLVGVITHKAINFQLEVVYQKIDLPCNRAACWPTDPHQPFKKSLQIVLITSQLNSESFTIVHPLSNLVSCCK